MSVHVFLSYLSIPATIKAPAIRKQQPPNMAEAIFVFVFDPSACNIFVLSFELQLKLIIQIVMYRENHWIRGDSALIDAECGLTPGWLSRNAPRRIFLLLNFIL